MPNLLPRPPSTPTTSRPHLQPSTVAASTKYTIPQYPKQAKAAKLKQTTKQAMKKTVRYVSSILNP